MIRPNSLAASAKYVLLIISLSVITACKNKSSPQPSDPSTGGSNQPGNNAYIVSDFAGDGTHGFVNGTGTSATFDDPYGIAIDVAGNLYVADSHNNSIRKITPAGVVSTLAGSGAVGIADGAGPTATFNYPGGLAVDGSGNIYVADTFNHMIRKVAPDGTVSTVAGSGVSGFADGVGKAAQFNAPMNIAITATGSLLVTDFNNQKIRKVTPSGIVSTLPNASFSGPHGIVVDDAGNIYVAESGRHVISKVTSGTGAVSIYAGNPQPQGSFINGPAASATFFAPEGLAIDADRNMYVGDLGNHMIRKITPQGQVSTLAGTLTQGHVNGPATSAMFYAPSGICIDAAGNFYVADPGNYRIRKIQYKADK